VPNDPQTWTVTPTGRDPRGIAHLWAAGGALAAVPVISLLFRYGAFPPTRLNPTILVVAIFVGGVLWAVLALALLARRIEQTVTLGADGVEIVGSPSPVRVRRLRFDRIHSIEPRWGSRPVLILYPSGWAFPAAIGGKGADPKLLVEVAGAIRDGIAALPDGSERLAGIEVRARAATTLVGRIPVTTVTTVVLLIVAILIQLAMGCVPFHESCAAMALANVPKAVAAGEVHRLLTANLVHADVAHYVVNIIGLGLLGSPVELALGWRRTALLFVLGGIAAQAAGAMWGGYAWVVGASGILYACLGALLWIHVRRGDEVPGRLRLVQVAWILFAIGIGTELLAPRISSATHIGGLVAGFALTPLLVGGGPLFRRWERKPGLDLRADGGERRKRDEG